MRTTRSKSLLAAIGLALVAMSATRAQATPILLHADFSFTEGNDNDQGGDWFAITNGSDPGIQILELVLHLDSGLVFDTSGGGAGQSPARDLDASAPPPGGSWTASGAGDGSTSLQLSFSGFDPGEGFAFSIDVDDTTGRNPGARREVGGSRFAGSRIEILFGASAGGSTWSSGSFGATGATTAGGSIDQQGVAAAHAPEPASIALFGAGLFGLPWLRRRRS